MLLFINNIRIYVNVSFITFINQNNIYNNNFFFYLLRKKEPKYLTTYSDGYLGSRNDEERSEMRYVMRIADSVNHQNFERKLHFRGFLSESSKF